MQDHPDIYELPIMFDANKLLEAYRVLAQEVNFTTGLVSAISLNTKFGSFEADPRGIFWIKTDNHEEVQRETYVDESAYTELIPAAKNTYFEEIYNELRAHYKIGRMRILSLVPRKSLSFHRDPEPRLHIPILTNPGALMIVDDYCTHMPANGRAYFMNTKKYHTALNGGESLRVHLVVTILNKEAD